MTDLDVTARAADVERAKSVNESAPLIVGEVGRPGIDGPAVNQWFMSTEKVRANSGPLVADKPGGDCRQGENDRADY